MSKLIMEKSYFIPVEIREAYVNFGLICDVNLTLEFRHNVDVLILKIVGKFAHSNGSAINFQPNLNEQIKYFLDTEQNKRETRQKKQSIVFEFLNNNLVAIYKKNKYTKLNKNGSIVDTNQYCQNFLEAEKEIFMTKIYQLKEVYINIFKFIGIIKNNFKFSSPKKCLDKQKLNNDLINYKNERKAILNLQKRLQKVLSNDSMIVVKNLFQPSMLVALQPKITERSVVLQKLRVRNNEKKKQREEQYFKQMNFLSDVMNNELKLMIEEVFKDFLFGSHTTNIYKIQNIDEDQKIELQIIGGVSVVQKVDKIKLKYQPQNSDEIREQQFASLAKKMFKQSAEIKNLENSKKRFTRELEIIKYICTKSQKQKIYMPRYYYMPGNNKAYYSTWYPISLSSYLHTLKIEGDKFQLEEVLYLCIQIVLIVIDLHSSGVVHRDLKPSNFVVNIEGSHPKLILIDFSQSMIIQNEARQVEEQNLTVYSTPMYCPLESSTFSKQYKRQGLIKTEIDRWSVGILIYEILHRFLPISYSSSTLKDIHTLWQTQFLQQFNLKNRSAIDRARQLIQFATFNLLHVKQEERMELQRILGILLICRSYCREIKQIYLKQTLNSQV